MIHFIITSLISYYFGTPIKYDDDTKEFITKQNNIGWDHFIRGRVTQCVEKIVQHKTMIDKKTTSQMSNNGHTNYVTF